MGIRVSKTSPAYGVGPRSGPTQGAFAPRVRGIRRAGSLLRTLPITLTLTLGAARLDLFRKAGEVK